MGGACHRSARVIPCGATDFVKILIAPDKFKDALTSHEACEIIAAALAVINPESEVDLCPLTDGGEGFTEILTKSVGGRLEHVRVRNARGMPVTAPVGFVQWDRVPAAARELLGLQGLAPHDRIALVGMASASGLEQLPIDQRNPWRANSGGTGELLLHARLQGARAVLLGIGGSATHDLGLGALHAVGARLLKKDGGEVDWPSPDRWSEIGKIVPPTDRWPPIRIACDVANPLLGARGAAQVYSVQKGLHPDEIPALEAATNEMAAIICSSAHRQLASAAHPGAGAAGGIAFGLGAFLQAERVEGAELVTRWLSLETRVAAADLVITGEGCYDASSLEGKGPGAVIRLAEKSGKPLHFFAGAALIPSQGRCHLHVITPSDQLLPLALRNCSKNLLQAVKSIFAPGPSVPMPR